MTEEIYENDGIEPRTIKMSDDWYMVTPMTKSMAEAMYDNLDAEEYDELDAVDMTREGFIRECMDGDHTCAVFAGKDIVFMCTANWIMVDGVKRRLWDTMSTRFVRENGHVRSFVKHTNEMIETFMHEEPTDTVLGICKSDFARSRKWIEKVAKFREIGPVGINNHWFTVYEYTSAKRRRELAKEAKKREA